MLIHIIFSVFNIWCFDFFEEVYHNMLHFRLLVLSWTKRLQIPPFLWKSFLTCTYFFWLWNLLKHQNACCLTRWLFPERPMKNPSANNSKLHSRLVGCIILTNAISNILFIFQCKLWNQNIIWIFVLFFF
jgi:hypothetical protein